MRLVEMVEIEMRVAERVDELVALIQRVSGFGHQLGIVIGVQPRLFLEPVGGFQGLGGRGGTAPETPLTIARLRYGPGDWYGNPTSLPNLLAFVREELSLPTAAREAVVSGQELSHRLHRQGVAVVAVAPGHRGGGE